MTDQLSDAELADLQSIFPTKTTRMALYGEAYEQALIEMHNGPIDLSHLPPIPAPLRLGDADTQIKLRQIRLMVERTAELLREYLAAYRAIKP